MTVVTFALTIIFSGFFTVDRVCWNGNFAVVFKLLASICFVLTIILAYKKGRGDNKFFNYMLCGFIFSLFGDLFLGVKFPMSVELGLLSFALAQIMFTLSFVYMTGIKKPDIIVFVAITVFTLLFERAFKDIDFGKLYPLVVMYTVLICAMVAKSFSLIKLRSQNSICVSMIVTGMVMFYFSDLVLMFAMYLKGADKSFAYINTFLYFTAQALVGLSFIFPLKKLDKKH